MESKYKVMAIEKAVVKRFPEARKPHSVDYDEAKDFMFEFKADGEAYTSAVVPYICDWREYRQIYNFDPDLENELVSNFQKDFEYPVEFLFGLPCNVFVLKTKESEFIIRSVPEKRHFAIFDKKMTTHTCDFSHELVVRYSQHIRKRVCSNVTYNVQYYLNCWKPLKLFKLQRNIV